MKPEVEINELFLFISFCFICPAGNKRKIIENSVFVSGISRSGNKSSFNRWSKMLGRIGINERINNGRAAF
jgi:hypothetical protein